MGINMDISQAVAYSTRLRNAGTRTGARAAQALRKTALDIETDAKILAPVDTGTLQNSISTTISGDGRHGQMAAEIGPTVEYGIYQEYGTSTQPGKPYMTPAFDRRIGPFEASLAKIAEADL